MRSSTAFPPKSSVGEFFGSLSQLTPGLPRDAPPPPAPQLGNNPLPDLLDHEDVSPASDAPLVYPISADLRLDLDTEDLALRTEKCSETTARASLVS